MKNALICLEKLGIGGVETFTITQVNEFNRRGIKCVVLAKDGILSENVKNRKKIEFIEYDFELKNEIDFDKVHELEQIIKKKKIDFIYVHQFSCVPYILPCAFKYNIPYIAYLHNIVPGTLDWFMDTFPIYKSLFQIYFENASKIIAITDPVKKEHQEIFKLNDERYITIKNSLDFTKFPDIEIPKIPKKFKKLLLFGRVSEQKRQSIYTAVEFFNWCRENYNKDMQLTVVGDGEIFEEIKEKYKDTDIYFKGAVSDMKKEIEKADILLGVDRCMLEAVASKKPAVICGYKNNVVLITPKNLKQAIEENFGGYSLGNDKEELFKYQEQELKEIIKENYDYIKENLSISNSVYLDIAPFPNHSMTEFYLRELSRLAKENTKLRELNELIKEENSFITDELNNIRNSKRWKLIDRPLNTISRIRKK